MTIIRRLAAPAARLSASRVLPPSVTSSSKTFISRNYASASPATPEIPDPEMNGGYINPVRVKRALRDPYGDWWDKQDRRNFGEPIHDDHDILGIFSPEPYNHFPPKKVLFLNACFITFVLSIASAAYLTYPDKAAAPRTFPGGLDRELGFTIPARSDEEES